MSISQTEIAQRVVESILAQKRAPGERLGEQQALETTYSRMGDFLKQKCSGYHGYIFTGNMDLAKKIGLKAKRRIEFYNSTIDCRAREEQGRMR